MPSEFKEILSLFNDAGIRLDILKNPDYDQFQIRMTAYADHESKQECGCKWHYDEVIESYISGRDLEELRAAIAKAAE